MKNLLLLLSLIFVFTVNLHSDIIIHYVKYNAAGSNDGTSWTNAYNSFQSALTVAVSGDQIWVASGTYKPTVQVGGTGDRYQTFQMIDGVAIYGGFAGTETAISQRTNFGAGQTNGTILSGDIGIANDSTDNCYHVIYNTAALHLTSSAVLDGFTIKGGNANGAWPSSHAGGMYNDGCSPTINNCAFLSNSADNAGGLWNISCSPSFTNCIFTSNSAGNEGGGIWNHSSSPTFTNCTVTANSAITNGGGMHNYASYPTLNNCIVWGNTAGSGNEFYHYGNTMTLNYSCYGNDTGDIYIVTGYFLIVTNNNITTNPQFAGTSINPTNPYSVLGTSPCVDAGNDSYSSQPYDIRGAGYPRKLDKTTGGVGTIDMGAYEYKLSVDPLPVELTSFTASVNGAAVTLNWQTATELNNCGFEIERRTISNQQIPQSSINNWQKIGFVKGAGTVNAPKEYSYTDNNLSAGKYAYHIKHMDNDGSFKYYGNAEAEIAAPKEFALGPNFPNPFNPSTNIEFSIPIKSFVSLKVFDLEGREVATLMSQEKLPGTYRVAFDASKLSSGVYYYRMHVGSFTMTKKMALLK